MLQLAVKVSELVPLAITPVSVQGEDIVVIKDHAGGVYAFQDRCSHADVALSGGSCDGFEIECPAHGARFDLESGAAKCMPAIRPIKKIPVSVEGDVIFVDLD